MRAAGFCAAVLAATALSSPGAMADLVQEGQAAIDRAIASPECDEADGTFAGCANAVTDAANLLAAGKKATALADTSEARERSQDKTTSDETAGDAPPLRDVLSRLIAAAGIPGLSEEDGKVVFAYNTPGLLGDEFKLSLRATAQQGEVYEPLLVAFAEDVRAEKKTAFEDQLGEFDDVLGELTFSRLSERWGREFGFHQDLFQALWAEAADRRLTNQEPRETFLALLNGPLRHCPGVPEDFAGAPFQDLAKAIQDFSEGLNEKCEKSEPSCRQLPPTCPPDDAECEQLRKSCEECASRCEPTVIADSRKELIASAVETSRAFLELVAIAEENGVMEVADLVSNQPQLFLGIKHRDRDGELSGPDETSVEFKWEAGLRNVNGLRRYCAKRQELRAFDGLEQPTLNCVADFLACSNGDSSCPDGRNLALRSWRASIKGEYTEVDGYDFSPETGIDVVRDGSEAWKVIGALGWQLTTEADGTGGSRLDFDGGYEDLSDDPMKNDRLVATLTYSQQLAGETAASISLVWANKPEYLGEVDEELGARVGLKWTMDPQED